jgi:UDP-N-acetylglucosamine--N-acetylmuramyl-(pentapeptide) pyrophosphoryl-undecaprenol N-acetylglucosamine transferase
MKRNLKVVLTGGGTAGHVMLHLALLPLMVRQHWNITYILKKS